MQIINFMVNFDCYLLLEMTWCREASKPRMFLTDHSPWRAISKWNDNRRQEVNLRQAKNWSNEPFRRDHMTEVNTYIFHAWKINFNLFVFLYIAFLFVSQKYVPPQWQYATVGFHIQTSSRDFAREQDVLNS